MAFDPSKHHRRSIRLQHYDYSSRGAYFVTICVQNRSCMFGQVRNGVMHLNEQGVFIDNVWRGLGNVFENVTIDDTVLMPNHLHGIIWIGARPEEDGRTQRSAPTECASPGGQTQRSALTLASVIQRYKAFTTNEYSKRVKQSNWPAFSRRLWQTNYFEHIIRDDQSLQSIRYYIENNPARWMNDIENPAGDGTDNVERFIATLRPKNPGNVPVDQEFNLLLDRSS